MFKRCLVVIAAFAATSGSCEASGKIFYGSRAGMTVTVMSVEGLNSAKAVIRTLHTHDDAEEYCKRSGSDNMEDCIAEEIAIPLNDIVAANCQTGVFLDFGGDRFRFEGKLQRKPRDMFGKVRIRNLKTGKIAFGDMASGYSTDMGIFRALCPAAAPGLTEE